MTQDELTRLLRDWAAERPADVKRLDSLAARIHEGVVRGDGPAWAEGEQCRRLRSLLWGRLAFAGLGAAAALTAVWVAALLGRQTDSPSATTPVELALVSEPELAANARVFSEAERLFDGSLQWVANSEREVRMGVLPGDGMQAADSEPLLVRFVVVGRTTGERSWRKVWQADIVARAEQVIETVPETSRDNRISLWLHPMKDGGVVIDSRIVLRSPVHASCVTSDVLRPGRPAEVLSVKREDGEYRVFQMAAALTGAGAVEEVRP